jgi:hypothetical protein
MQSQYNELLAASVRVVHGIVCCRILLNIRQAAARGGGSTEMSHIIAFAAAPGQQTNQAETIQHEAYSMQSEEEGPHWQADGILLYDRHCPAGEAEWSFGGRTGMDSLVQCCAKTVATLLARFLYPFKWSFPVQQTSHHCSIYLASLPNGVCFHQVHSVVNIAWRLTFFKPKKNVQYLNVASQACISLFLWLKWAFYAYSVLQNDRQLFEKTG